MSDYNRNLRIDRRLIRRRGWIPPEELERELDALPDVADKAVRGDPEGDEPPEGGSGPGQPAGA